MRIHIVKQGDSLYALSQKYGVPLQKIVEANPQISNPDALTVGEKVKIPAAPVAVPDNNELYYKHTVKQGDTLWKLSKAWGITLKELIDANPQLKNPNALLTGEVVNIPKKTSTSPIQPQSIQGNITPVEAQDPEANENPAPVQPQAVSPAVIDKTKVGGKTYTGPKEQPVPETSPIAAPVPVPVPAPVPVPTPVPAPAPAPVNAPLPNQAPEIIPVPVQEVVHETQSLFVQITVPAQEAIAHEIPKEKEKTEIQPVYHESHKAPSCDKTAGYPGLHENPYFFDSQPPVQPYYEPMPVMGINSVPNYVQPAVYMPDCVSPYAYPGSVYPAADFPNAWQPNAAPEYANMPLHGIGPATEYSPYAVPQYGAQQVNLPWPACGCGGGQQIQPYSYEQAAFNNMPPYYPQPEAISPYGANISPFGANISPYGANIPHYGENIAPYEANVLPQPNAAAAASIPPIPDYPVYPGAENFGHHNRVPEILEPELVAENKAETVNTENVEKTVKGKTGAGKTGAPKAKVSGQDTGKPNKTGTKQRSGQIGRGNAASKKRNPWRAN
ncbi:hypothetical protein C2I18_05540 [Paenibacillus sp. PK3_47]|uniref:LysM peptidoglycan-binding domain-containing protein n=1 Tax=Paenibacillus sp. PK3_47 TaxID=2072642 RepID=UPI00201DD92E|nr:LysM peptidoglycan-binding domain-containing protein [Paenibacillus sp. PK3_47]UQZ33067.1 hypothetical protein C2I18_05540 [Paenibacillus sp. PK3_47]